MPKAKPPAFRRVRLLLVAYRDRWEVPRAWAIGPETEPAAVRQRARTELAAYLADPARAGLTAADFTKTETTYIDLVKEPTKP